MTTLRRFTLPTKDGIIHIQESSIPDDVRIQVEFPNDVTFLEVRMTQAQFQELCRLGIPGSHYYRSPDEVRFQTEEQL